MSNHECSACGGVGESVTYAPSEITTGRLAGAEYTSIKCCPVCLGSGRISDVRTARDAMVDAETLRRVLAGIVNTRRRSEAHDALYCAGQHGATARFQATSREPWAPGPGAAWFAARLAARAAFRAVPALRGEA